VIIVGCGPVGLMTACELQRHGITNILLLEKIEKLNPYTKASNIHSGTMDILRMYPELFEILMSEVTSIKGIKISEKTNLNQEILRKKIIFDELNTYNKIANPVM